MNHFAFAFGEGLASSLLFFPLTYLALSRQLGVKFSNIKIIVLLLLTAFCIGLIDSMLRIGFADVNPYLDLFAHLGIPIIASATVIFAAHKTSSNTIIERAAPATDGASVTAMRECTTSEITAFRFVVISWVVSLGILTFAGYARHEGTVYWDGAKQLANDYIECSRMVMRHESTCNIATDSAIRQCNKQVEGLCGKGDESSDAFARGARWSEMAKLSGLIALVFALGAPLVFYGLRWGLTGRIRPFWPLK